MVQTEEIRDLSLYIHIPFCKAKCSYCDFLSFGDCGYSFQKQYMDALKNEIRAYGKVAEDYRVRTIFIGGGTPSYIDSSWIVDIINVIKDTFLICDDAEITLEGNPDSLTREHLKDYVDAGINRLSIGLQSANHESLKRLSRIHNFDQFVAAFNSARQAGFRNINVDVMSGLPGESMEDYVHTLAKVVEMNPEHISAYSLIVEEGTPLSEDDGLLSMLPSEELDRQMYSRTKTLLKNSGYNRYEISNYAKKGFECKHNIVYWTGGEYLGLGLGASSYLRINISEDKWKTLRFHGIEKMSEYINYFSACDGMREDEYTGFYHEMEGYPETDDTMFYYGELDYVEGNLSEYRLLEENAFLEFIRDYYRDLHFSSRKEEMEEMMFLGLRLMDGVSKKDFYNRFAVSMDAVYGKIIEKYKQKNLLIETDDRIHLSDAGIDVSNVVMAEFML